jgi:obg-like ATPase 1
VNPARDLDIIHSELRFKDTEYLNKQMDDLEKSAARSGDKKRKPDYVKFL